MKILSLTTTVILTLASISAGFDNPLLIELNKLSGTNNPAAKLQEKITLALDYYETELVQAIKKKEGMKLYLYWSTRKRIEGLPEQYPPQDEAKFENIQRTALDLYRNIDERDILVGTYSKRIFADVYGRNKSALLAELFQRCDNIYKTAEKPDTLVYADFNACNGFILAHLAQTENYSYILTLFDLQRRRLNEIKSLARRYSGSASTELQEAVASYNKYVAKFTQILEEIKTNDQKLAKVVPQISEDLRNLKLGDTSVWKKLSSKKFNLVKEINKNATQMFKDYP